MGKLYTFYNTVSSQDIYPDPKLGTGGVDKGQYSSPAIAAALTAVGCKLALKEQVIAKVGNFSDMLDLRWALELSQRIAILSEFSCYDP